MATARLVMKTELITVTEDMPLREAIQLLIDHKISGLPVVDGDGNLKGLFTEKDAMRLLFEDKGTCKFVSDLMVREVRTFQVGTPLEPICDCLMSNHFRRVPILVGAKLVGLISRADLMPTILAVASENSG